MSYLPGSNYSFQTVTSTPTPLVVGNRQVYVCKGTGILNFQLPASTLAGMSFKIIGQNCLWTIAQNAMQQIAFGPFSTTAGITGSLASTVVDDQIEVTCLTANTNWVVTQVTGNITIV
jgi:hypothetical protein